MKCVCPECGHVAGMTAFAGEAEARDCMAIALRMPRGLADNLMRYLSLFRPPKRALSWHRALKLMRELERDIDRGYVSRRGRDWAAPMDVWEAAIATVLEQRDNLTLPLRDHSYLHEIITRGANKTEAVAEQKREDKRRKRTDRESEMATPYDDPSLGAKPPGGSLKAALAGAARAHQSPTTTSNES